MRVHATLTNTMLTFSVASHDWRCDGLADELVRFLQPCFTVQEPGPHCDWTLALLHRDTFVAEEAAWQTVWFRRSACPAYNLSGWLTQGPAETVLGRDDASGVAYAVDRRARHVDLYVTPENLGTRVHLFDFPRYAAMLVAQARGWVTLHASAASLNGRLMLVLGDKGAGKTTTMLDLVAAGGAYFSGDKVMAKVVDDALVLHAWPDMPYIGTGSLARHPRLATRLGVSLVHPDGSPVTASEKHLVDPFLFREAVAQEPVQSMREATVLLPNVGAGARQATFVPPADRRADALTALVEWPHEYLTAQWHGMFLDEARAGIPDGGTAVLDRLCRLPWMRLDGYGAVGLLDDAA